MIDFCHVIVRLVVKVCSLPNPDVVDCEIKLIGSCSYKAKKKAPSDHGIEGVHFHTLHYTFRNHSNAIAPPQTGRTDAPIKFLEKPNSNQPPEARSDKGGQQTLCLCK